MAGFGSGGAQYTLALPTDPGTNGGRMWTVKRERVGKYGDANSAEAWSDPALSRRLLAAVDETVRRWSP